MCTRHLPLLLVPVLAGCPSPFQPPFFNYLDCVKKTSAEYRREGKPELKAELDARDYCRTLFPKEG